jgi:hypothetical protein
VNEDMMLKLLRAGQKLERERIVKLLDQLGHEWRDKLSYYMHQNNAHEISRYRNYILALDDLMDMTADPESFIGEAL